MTRFILRRLLGAIPVLIVGCSIVFVIVFALPGDPISSIGGGRSLPESTRNALAAKYHFDEPLWRQLFRFLGGIVRGDLGESIRTRRTVRSMLAEAVPVTMRVAVIAVMIEAVIGSMAAVVAVVTKRRFVDALVTTSTIALVAVPTFVLGSILQFSFGVHWRVFPVAGLTQGWRSYVLPCTSLAAVSVAYVARLLRVRLEDEMGRPYVVTARAKGLSERGVTRHAFRNALPVVITFLGFDIATLLGGAIVTEIIFNINGVGTLVARAISQRDQIVIVGVSVVSIGLYVVAGIVVDVIVAALDPRVRVS